MEGAALDLRTRVVVLTHEQERRKPTNTGRLVPVALTNSEVRIRGRKGAPMPTEGLVAADRRTLVLYPSDRALELTPERVLLDPRPITLVVPDGNWGRQRACPSECSG